MFKIWALALALTPFSIQAENICQNIKKDSQHKITEADFNFENTLVALSHLKHTLPALIKQNNEQFSERVLYSDRPIRKLDVTMSSILLNPTFKQYHSNNLAIVEGFLLRQQVVINKQKNMLSQSDEAKKAFEKARTDFCQHVESSSYVE